MQAEASSWQAISSKSLMPSFLQVLQSALQPNLALLDASPVKFSNAWSVLMFALASTEPSFTHAAARCTYISALNTH